MAGRGQRSHRFGQAVPKIRGWAGRRGPPNSLSSQRQPRPFDPPGVVEVEQRPSRTHAAIRDRLAGPQPYRVRDAGPALHRRCDAGRRATPADRARRRFPALSDLVARRRPDRLRLVERRAARRDPHCRRRWLEPAHDHPDARPLPPPALLARRRQYIVYEASGRRRHHLQPMVDEDRIFRVTRPAGRHPHPRRGRQPAIRRRFRPRLHRGQRAAEAQADQRRPQRRRQARPCPGRDGHRLRAFSRWPRARLHRELQPLRHPLLRGEPGAGAVGPRLADAADPRLHRRRQLSGLGGQSTLLEPGPDALRRQYAGSAAQCPRRHRLQRAHGGQVLVDDRRGRRADRLDPWSARASSPWPTRRAGSSTTASC